MSFLESIAKVKSFLDQHQRVSLRALMREFDLDEDTLEELVTELVEVQQYAAVDGQVLALAKSPKAAVTDSAPDEVVGERRQATVVFSDLSGYTRLTELLDPEEVELLVRRLKSMAIEVVEAHGGIVNQFVGDEVLALFGVPKAHSDDPRRAARAAHEIHKQARDLLRGMKDERKAELRMHTGIATGLVVAIARDSRDGHFGVTGDTVNIAARLRSLAGSDEILMDDATRQLAATDFVLESLPAVEVRGRSAPIKLFRVGEVSTVTPARQTSFVGRTLDLQQFDAILSRVLNRNAAEVWYVRGEAGIGKTRFVEECQRIACQRSGIEVHKALVLSFGSGAAKDALRSLISSILDVQPDDNVDRRRRIAKKSVAGLVSGEQLLPSLNDLLDVPQSGPAQRAYEALDTATRERRLRQTAAELVRAAARECPQLLIVEDIHWANQSLLARLAALADSIKDLPVLLLMNSRIEGDPLGDQWRQDAGDIPMSTVDLVGLPAEEAMQLSSSYSNVDSIAAQACIERADGNPLFLEVLLQSADETGSSESLPGSIQSVVLARLDQLPAMHKFALQCASILGQRFSLAALRFVSGQSGYSPEVLVQHYLVRPEAGEMMFSHALIHEGIYHSLLHSHARRLHLKAANWFAERDLTLYAQHLGRAKDERAAAAYVEAASAQVSAFRHSDALALIEEALSLEMTPSERVAATCLEGETLNELGSAEQALKVFESVANEGANVAERCRIRLGLATSLRALERPREGIPILEAAEEEAKEEELYHILSEIQHLKGNLCFPLGDMSGCLTAHQKALKYAERVDSREGMARALGGLADGNFVAGRLTTAMQFYRDSAMLARELGLARIEVANYIMVAWNLVYVDPRAVDEIRRISSESEIMAEQVNDPRSRVLATICPAFHAAHFLQDVGDAEVRLNEAARLIEEFGGRRFEPFIGLGLGLIAHRRDDRETARMHLERGLAAAHETGIGFLGPMAVSGLALSQDEPARAEALMKEAEEMIAAGCAGHNQLLVYKNGFHVSLKNKNWDEAERYGQLVEDSRANAFAAQPYYFLPCHAAAIRYARGDRDDELLAKIDNHLKEVRKNGLWESTFDILGLL